MDTFFFIINDEISFNRCMGDHSYLEIIQMISSMAVSQTVAYSKQVKKIPNNKMKNSGSNCT